MTKYTVEVKNLSPNGFQNTITYDNFTFDEAMEILQHYKRFYAYVCEYKISKYEEQI